MGYKLVDHGYQFKKIMQGRAWVGRVCRMGDGSGWLGKIGQHEYKSTISEEDAFYEVASRAMGYDSHAAFAARQRAVRSQRRSARLHARHVMDEIMRGNFKPLDELFSKGDK